MISRKNPTLLYLIGILIFFGVLLLLTRNYVIPRIFSPIEIDTYDYLSKPSAKLDSNMNYLANISTNLGNITVNLYEDNAPENVNNFIYLSQIDYYKNTKFHRIINDTLIQGGDRNTLNNNKRDDGQGKAPYFIIDEVNWDSIGLSEEKKDELRKLGYSSNTNLNSKKLQKYSVAMANSGPNTNSSQFFIVLADSNSKAVEELQGRFTVIGSIVDGFDTIDKINNTPVEQVEGNSFYPIEDVIIQEIEIITR